MTTSQHIVALLKSHIDGDESRFLSVATQLAAHEARQGHGKAAEQVDWAEDLVDRRLWAVRNLRRQGDTSRICSRAL